MSAIATSADGAYVFLALEDGDGFQIILKAVRADLSAWTAAYEPGAGSAANVAPVPCNPDKMLFYGNFDTDIVVILHTISTGDNTDISPASLGANIVNTLAVNPSSADEIIITTESETVQYTGDGGDNWSELDGAIGFAATALAVLWSGDYDYHRLFVAGQTGPVAQLLYSPNECASYGDYTGSMSVTNIASLVATEEDQL